MQIASKPESGNQPLDQLKFNALLDKEIEQMCRIAIEEDLAGIGNPDITAELIDPNTTAKATLITREAGIFCGKAWLEKVFELLAQDVSIDWLIGDGEEMRADQQLCILDGNARSLLTGERSAMNFLQSLSATATLTSIYLKKMNNSGCQLLDTRKTIPGMRFGQKYAVKCGGGTNHRIGLSDAYLIKENHIMACGGIEKTLSRAIEANPAKLLEIEVENLDELRHALAGKAQVIMLDNFNNQQLSEAVRIRDQSSHPAKLEASGNVNLETIQAIAQTGVDYISVGALTKDIKAVDLSMRVQLG